MKARIDTWTWICYSKILSLHPICVAGFCFDNHCSVHFKGTALLEDDTSVQPATARPVPVWVGYHDYGHLSSSSNMHISAGAPWTGDIRNRSEQSMRLTESPTSQEQDSPHVERILFHVKAGQSEPGPAIIVYKESELSINKYWNGGLGEFVAVNQKQPRTPVRPIMGVRIESHGMSTAARAPVTDSHRLIHP